MHAVLEQVVREVSKVIQPLDADTAQRQPGGRAHDWSAQQVIEHLILSYRTTSRLLEHRLKKGKPSRQQERTWLQWALQVMILSFGRMPQGVATLNETCPETGEFPPMNGEQLAELLYAELQLLDAVLDRCRRKFDMERVAVHPWLGPLRVDQWRRYHVIHGLHHAAQLRSILDQVDLDHANVLVISPRLAEKVEIPV